MTTPLRPDELRTNPELTVLLKRVLRLILREMQTAALRDNRSHMSIGEAMNTKATG